MTCVSLGIAPEMYDICYITLYYSLYTVSTRHRNYTNFFGDIVYHGGISDGTFNTIMNERLNELHGIRRRRVKIKRPQFLHQMPARFMQGGNVSRIIIKLCSSLWLDVGDSKNVPSII